MLMLILDGAPMQYGDYFGILGSLFSRDGVFTPLGLIEHANEHLVLIPKLVYLANIALFGGSNVTLGVFVWLTAVATAAVLMSHMRSLFETDPTVRVVLAWSAAVFFFPLAAAHNFLFAMSGTCWLLANFFAVCAVVSAVNRHPVRAGLFGALGTFSYGTGLAIWPALFLILVRQRRFSTPEALMLIIGAASVAIERFTAVMSLAVAHHPPLETDPPAILRSMMVASGSLFTQSVDVALLLGAATIALVGFLLVRSLHIESENRPAAILTGLITYGLFVLLLLAVSRAGFGDNMLQSSRYMAVIALFMLAVTLLSFLLFEKPTAWCFAAAMLIQLNLAAAVPLVKDVQANGRYHQDIGALAARLGTAPSTIFGYRKQTTAVLQALNHYPFNAAGDQLGCGLIGARIDTSAMAEDPSVQGWLDDISPIPESSAIKVAGWVEAERDVECILIANEANEVVGAAVRGWDREDARRAIRGSRTNIGWQGVTREMPGESLRAVVRLKGKPDFFELGTVR